MKRAVHRAASAVLRAKHAVQNQAADVSGLMRGKTRMGKTGRQSPDPQLSASLLKYMSTRQGRVCSS